MLTWSNHVFVCVTYGTKFTAETMYMDRSSVYLSVELYERTYQQPQQILIPQPWVVWYRKSHGRNLHSRFLNNFVQCMETLLTQDVLRLLNWIVPFIQKIQEWEAPQRTCFKYFLQDLFKTMTFSRNIQYSMAETEEKTSSIARTKKIQGDDGTRTPHGSISDCTISIIIWWLWSSQDHWRPQHQLVRQENHQHKLVRQYI